MPDYTFGGDSAGTVENSETGRIVAGAQLKVFDAESGGIQVTNVKRLDGTSYTNGIVVATSLGRWSFVLPGAAQEDYWIELVGSETEGRWHAGLPRETIDQAVGALQSSDMGIPGGPAGPLTAGSTVPSAQIPDLSTLYITAAQKGAVNGVATLDAAGKVPAAQIPLTADPAVKSEVPSIEEIATSSTLIWPPTPGDINRVGTDTILREIGLLSLPFDWYLLSVDLVFRQPVAASDVNYWTIRLRRIDYAAANVLIAEKTTKATGANAEAITDRKPWRFTTGAMDATNRLIGADQYLAVDSQPTGVPANLVGVAFATVRYARQ